MMSDYLTMPDEATDYGEELDISVGECRWTYTPDSGWNHQCDSSKGNHLAEPKRTRWSSNRSWRLDWVVENECDDPGCLVYHPIEENNDESP